VPGKPKTLPAPVKPNKPAKPDKPGKPSKQNRSQYMVLNPGTRHFDIEDGSPIIKITDFPPPLSLVTDVIYNSQAVVSD
jgi:hypothetical protein